MFSRLIHVVTNGRIFFLWLNNIPLHLYHIFFIYSSIDGHLACLHVLAIVNNAAMNGRVQKFLQDSDFIFFRNTPSVRLLYRNIVLFSIYWVMFSIAAAPIYIPTNSAQGLSFLHILANTYLLSFLIITILTGIRWISLWFWFLFTWWLMMLSIFSCTCCPFVCLLWKKMSIQVLCSFSNQIICGFGFLLLFCFVCYWVIQVPYIFCILTPYQICGLQVFSLIL